jgi:hypothetical protein
MPYRSTKKLTDRVWDSKTVASEKRATNERVTGRMPHRSMILPMRGILIAPATCETKMAPAKVERLQPNSSVIGFRNKPDVKRIIGVFPTIIPRVAPKTTHQGFRKTGTYFIAMPFSK